MGTQTKPYDWSATPASWTDIGQRIMFEVYDVMAGKYTGRGTVEATANDIMGAVDRAIRSVTPLETVQAWVADKCSDIPAEVTR